MPLPRPPCVCSSTSYSHDGRINFSSSDEITAATTSSLNLALCVPSPGMFCVPRVPCRVPCCVPPRCFCRGFVGLPRCPSPGSHDSVGFTEMTIGTSRSSCSPAAIAPVATYLGGGKGRQGVVRDGKGLYRGR
eukprot:6907537-Prymnesium_polylepis.1